MGNTKLKILSFFLLFLFIQRMGGAMLVKVYIQEHIYKEISLGSHSKKDGKVKTQKLLCSNNRIYEECHTAYESPVNILPAQQLVYVKLNHRVPSNTRVLGIFLKKSALRGPPSLA